MTGGMFLPSSPGTGVAIDETCVRHEANTQPNRRNPIRRPPDGGVPEW